jgi:peptidoglycan hydrolase-like protein with peptidoglycan-binding domain
MFLYQDPTSTNFLQTQGALDTYRGRLHAQYETASKLPGTKFLPIRAFSQLPPVTGVDRLITFAPGASFSNATVPWNAFPRRNQAVSNTQVDTNRPAQEEYVEWAVQSNAGKLSNITFTTEFAAYFQTLADHSFEALVAGIKQVIPNANPTVTELFGTAQKPAPLLVDGIVGPTTWSLLERILDRPPANAPILRRGSQGEAVKWLQTRLTWLNLFDGKLTGLFDQTTENAVKAAQKRFMGAGELFRQNLPNNPWNNGQKGILCMANFDNTLPLLFGLLSHCAVPRRDVSPQEVCRLVGGTNCVPGRSSDPNVCMAVQTEALKNNVFSPVDPVGIQILKLQGIWRINNTQIDINDPQKNQGAWQVSRGDRRGVLKNLPGLTLDGLPITSGGQVARKLQVGLKVMIAAEQDLKR